MNIDFHQKNVLVTGAARGIGQAIVTAFAKCGATVWAGDILTQEVDAYAKNCAPGVVHSVFLDVTDEVSVQSAVAQMKNGIDVLVYVAGGVCGQTPQPLENVSLAQWKSIVDVNLTGAFLCARAVVPAMKAHKSGRIITISSRAGLAPSFTGIQSYCASKHGQLGFVKQLGQELAPFNITVNSIAPGFMKTNPDTEKQWARYTPEFQKAFVDKLVGHRLGAPEDIAHAALFLASDYASWITGQVVPVTGMAG